MMLKPVEVYIVLVNYRSWRDTVECLESLFKMAYSNFKVLVVDNDSQDGSILHLQNWATGVDAISPPDALFYDKTSIESLPVAKPIPFALSNSGKAISKADFDSKLLLIASKANLGFAGGNNIGIRLALAHQAEYIWLLNNDTVVAKDTLNKLVEHSERAKQANIKLGIVGAKLLYFHDPTLVQAVLGRYRPFFASTDHIGLKQKSSNTFKCLQIQRDDYIVGASMFVSAKFIHDVGLMSEDYFLYFEEIDWVKRGGERGYKIDVCLDAVVYHKEGASIGGASKDKNNKSELSDFYSVRNRLLITHKYYRKYLLPVYISLIFVAVNRIRRKQFSRIPLLLKAIKSSLRSKG